MATLDLGILVSGRGSNLQAVLRAIEERGLDARVRLVISSRPEAPALGHAAAAGVASVVLEPRAYPTRAAYDEALVAALRGAQATWILLAGFMRIVGPTFLEAFPSRVLNVHPALCPAFPGRHAQAQALAAGVRVTGCTVHLVDAELDGGPIIAQAVVPVRPDDDVDSLSARILGREHELVVSVLQWLAEGRVWLEPGSAPSGRTVVRARGELPVPGLAQPSTADSRRAPHSSTTPLSSPGAH
jgi:phosphoribosylglycinamide formyltransferase-1